MRCVVGWGKAEVTDIKARREVQVGDFDHDQVDALHHDTALHSHIPSVSCMVHEKQLAPTLGAYAGC